VLAAILLALTCVASDVVSSHKSSSAQTIYIRNLAPQYISDATIKRDIPAWEHAVNVDFAKYWYTTQYHLVFIGTKPAPVGAVSAVFVNKGPVTGALAYHWLGGNAPAITVYAGTDDYYNYDNSVSFTHELFELAADPVTSYLNVGYPDDYYWLEKPNTDLKVETNTAVGWFNEVCDPVEADFYRIHGVEISDFITPAWFNDGVGQRYDFMGLAQQPFWIRPGGYAQYLDATGWNLVDNFRKGHPSDAGFSKGDPDGRK
jgi:hypothetical protein